MKIIALFLRLLFLFCMALLICLSGCTSYYKCEDCGAAYKYSTGFPGQFNLNDCGDCGTRHSLKKCSESESGWDEERYQRNGNEVRGSGGKL